MANPFYIQPGNDFGQGLAGLGQAFERTGEIKRQREEETRVKKRFEDAKAAMTAAFQSGDPEQIMQASIDYPELQKTGEMMFGFTNDRTKEAVRDTYRRVLSDPENAQQYLQEGINRVAEFGGKPVNMMTDLGMFLKNPEAAYKNVKSGFALLSPQEYKAMFPQSNAGSMIGKYNPRDYTPESWAQFMQNGDPATLRRYESSVQERIAASPDLVKAVAGSQATIAGAKAGSAEEAKLKVESKLRPDIEKNVTLSQEKAKQEVGRAGENRSNAVALNVYQTGMKSLEEGLKGTYTGPWVGLIPAITSSQQVAEGAIATMAPVLKQMFRSAGEGTFTKDDQEMLMRMLPTRSTRPEAAAAQIQAIDAIVKAKLTEPDAGAKSSGRVKWGEM